MPVPFEVLPCPFQHRSKGRSGLIFVRLATYFQSHTALWHRQDRTDIVRLATFFILLCSDGTSGLDLEVNVKMSFWMVTCPLRSRKGSVHMYHKRF